MKRIRKAGLQIGLTLVLVLSGFLSSLTPVAASELVNEVHISFGTAYTYGTKENSFTNGEVMGSKSWISGLHNYPEAISAVTDVGLTLDSPLEFDGIWPDPLTMGPPTYEWSFGDILPGQNIDVNVGIPFKGVNVIVPGQSGPFIPGFDASRSADNTIFTQTGTQTLTIVVTPRQALPNLNIGVWFIDVRVMNTENVISTITSPTTDDSNGIWLDPGGQNLNIRIENPAPGTTYTYQVIIQVTPLVPQVEFMPDVGVAWWETLVASGTATGSSFSRTVPELGTWTWSAAGDYSWQWGEGLSRSVGFMGYCNVEPNQPPIINAVTANPEQLWPPNHKAVDVTITADATDPDGPEGIVKITYSVVDEYGEYDVAEKDLPENGVISLIPERDGKDKDGRVYTIIVTVYDAAGLSDSASVDVVVPHDQGGKK
jgi:hypothetical protein